MAVLKSIDTDGSGAVNYTGISLITILTIIFGCHHREKCLYEIRETILGF